MWRNKRSAAILLVVSFLLAVPAMAQTPPTVQEIKKSLICLCDCNMTVEACEGAMACQSADKLTAEARQLIDQGLTKKAILASFVGRYGEHILSAPTKKGFNLTAWITPFAAILLTGYGIVQIVRKWSRRQQHAPPARNRQMPAADPRYEKALDDVLRKLN